MIKKMIPKHRQTLSSHCLLILACCLSEALQEDTNTVFVRENGPVELSWSLFIGENTGRSSVNVMIKKSNALLCQWVKAHWEVNQCDPGMNLTIRPKNVRVPGPTNITAAFSFKNKGRVDDGTYECRFVIDEKWHEMQMYPRYLVTTEPNVTLNATNHNTHNTKFICHVSGGRPRPVETILLKNGTEISRSRLICPEEEGSSDGDEDCFSIHSVENVGDRCKCRVEHAGYIVDSAEMSIPFTTVDESTENENIAACPGMNDCEIWATVLLYVITILTSITVVLVAFVVVLVYLQILVWRGGTHMKTYDRGGNVTQVEEETEQCLAHYARDTGSVEIVPLEMENEPCISEEDDVERERPVSNQALFGINLI